MNTIIFSANIIGLVALSIIVILFVISRRKAFFENELYKIGFNVKDIHGNIHYYSGDSVVVKYDKYNDFTRLEFLTDGKMSNYIPFSMLESITPTLEAK